MICLLAIFLEHRKLFDLSILLNIIPSKNARLQALGTSKWQEFLRSFKILLINDQFFQPVAFVCCNLYFDILHNIIDFAENFYPVCQVPRKENIFYNSESSDKGC